MSQQDTRALGLIIFGISLMATFFFVGMFHEHQIVVNTLLMMYMFGLSTVVGLMLVEVSIKEKKKVVRK